MATGTRRAWGIVDEYGVLDFRTLAETPRGARVAGLVHVKRLPVSASETDGEIEARWGAWRDRHQVTEVVVTWEAPL